MLKYLPMHLVKNRSPQLAPGRGGTKPEEDLVIAPPSTTEGSLDQPLTPNTRGSRAHPARGPGAWDAGCGLLGPGPAFPVSDTPLSYVCVFLCDYISEALAGKKA